MSKGLVIPQWVPATVTRFAGCTSRQAGGPGLVSPCYQVDAGRGHDRCIVLTEAEAEAVCKAILKDIRRAKAEKATG